MMNSSLQTLNKIYSEHIWLEISEEDLTTAEPSPREYSNETGRHYAFINRLCLHVFLRWMEEHLELETKLKIRANLPNIWEVVNGVAIALEKKRLVLIPSDAIAIQDLVVPQEWVDIPSWTADYYLPIQVDLEHRYLHIWGFISRRTLTEKADYDPIYRTYYVESDRIITNLDLLWAACQLCSDEKGEVAPLPILSECEAKNAIAQLSQPSPYSPRLEMKFEQWGALLNESRWLQELYQQRVKASRIVKLSQWFEGIVEAGWQTFEELLSPKTLAPAYRSLRVRGIKLDTPEEIERAIRQLYASQNEIAYHPSPNENLDVEALVHLLRKTEDESLRWKAAEYLWAIAPNHPDAAIRKVMDLGVQLMGHPVALMIAVLSKPNGQVAILLRAYPLRSQSKLPSGLQLIGLYENGNPIPGLEAIARSEPQDDYISLYFCADGGDRFGVRLTLENTSITEQFVV
jgi:hypothetical protein